MSDCNVIYTDLLNNNKIETFEDINIICSNNYDSCTNVYDSEDLCCKSFKKADVNKYYVNIYNRDWVYNLLKENININSATINEMFDLKLRTNCVNCVAIVLYSKNNIMDLYNYLYSMKKSLDNVYNALSGFVLRYYLDQSVFKTMYNEYTKYKNQNLIDSKGVPIGDKNNSVYLIKSFEILKYIINHECSEIYIYFCKNIINENNLEKVRIFRFLPLIEDDTNIIVVREADGFVSYSDCYNLKLFSNDDEHKILMMYEYANNATIGLDNNYKHYNAWLNIFEIIDDIYIYYKNNDNDNSIYKYLTDNFDKSLTDTSEKINFINQMDLERYFINRYKYKYKVNIDLLAGIFASKVRLNKTYYFETVKSINNVMKFYQEFLFNKTETINNFLSKINNQNVNTEQLLKMGYDEILLNKLYYPIITCKLQNLTNLMVLIYEKKKDPFFFIMDMLPKIFDETNRKKYYDDIEFIKSTNINNDNINPYLSSYGPDMIFSNNYKIQYTNEFKKNEYVNFNNELLNKIFENSLIFDKYYSFIYPENKQANETNKINTNSNYYIKYLKYKNKYLELKKKL